MYSCEYPYYKNKRDLKLISLRNWTKKSKLSIKQAEGKNKDWSENKWNKVLKKILEKIDKAKSGFFKGQENWKTKKTTLTGLAKKKRKKTQISKVRSERQCITTDLTELKGILWTTVCQ